MSRYKPTGSWSADETTEIVTHTVNEDEDVTRTLVTEVADALDTRTGDRYREGAWRVRLSAGPSIPGFRAKTFFGETAWSDARRLHYDVVTKLRFGHDPMTTVVSVVSL